MQAEDTDMVEGKRVIITGGVRGIGAEIARSFEREGATVCTIDCEEGGSYTGDLGDRETIEHFAQWVERELGGVDVLVNNAPPPMLGIARCSWDQFQGALAIGVTAPFYLTQCLLPLFSDGASIINITSTREAMSQQQGESYAAAKGALSSLTHALAISLGPRIRVNAIAPGWIDTTATNWEEAHSAQHPVGRIGRPEDIAGMVLFLSSERAGFITGQTITIDGGMSRLMVYHGDGGWFFRVPEEG